MRKPVPYSIEVFDLICERIADGESLNKIVKQEDMPAYGTVMVWLDKDLDGAQEKYARARAIQADKLAEATIDIADGEGDVQRDRLRVDARKWFASKVAPKKYGDKIQSEVSGQLTVSHETALAQIEREAGYGVDTARNRLEKESP